MLITFFSNYFNHHQKALCDALFSQDGVEFYFVETEPMEEFRSKMGWTVDNMPSYVLSAYESEEKKQLALELSDRSDLVIIGSAPEWYVERRIKNNSLTFRYTERPMKEGWIKMFIPRLGRKFYNIHYKNRNKNLFVLGASAYAAYDYSLLHSYPGKCLKFGYFPEGEKLSFEEILKKRSEAAMAAIDDNEKDITAEELNATINILWTGRFLKLKRADLLIKALGKLKRKGLSFRLRLVGNGEMEESLKALIASEGIEEEVKMQPFVKPKEVRCLMEEADIYVMTSNFLEGWGSVIYESLSAGCAVIASHACGCSPWLVKPEKTGLLFKSGSVDSLERMLERFIVDKELRNKCQKGAYEQMSTLWNPDVAARRIVEFADSFINNNGEIAHFEDGPLSAASILKNNWFKG